MTDSRVLKGWMAPGCTEVKTTEYASCGKKFGAGLISRNAAFNGSWLRPNLLSVLCIPFREAR